MSLNNLTPAQLRHAADLVEKIESLQNELSHLQGGAPAGRRGRGKRTISPEGLARIKAAQYKRWAKVKGGKTGRRGPRKMSAAARAKIAAAQKARWAKFHAAKAGK